MRGRLLAACVLLAGCSTMTHNAPVQERSPVISRETVPPVLTRTPPGQATPSAPGSSSPSGSARSPVTAAPPPKPPSNSAIAGLAPPQATGNGDEPVAVATPLKPEGGDKTGAPPKLASAAQGAQGARPGAPAAGAAPALPQIEWAWPVDTPIVQGYSEASKGVDFSGAMGQPVRAAAAGEVSFVGNSLRGYGLMVVVRHERGYMSVYAHNSKVLVKVGQKVERGQRIAEMGNTDAKDVVLHFEMRHQGKALDPAQTLPGR